jgi:transposase
MASRAAELVAAIIDRIEGRPCGTGRPALPTIKVVETLRFFVREGVSWRELRATAGRACGSTLRRRLDGWSATAVLRRVHVALIRMVRSGPEGAPWDVVVDRCSVRAKHGGELTGPSPTDRGKAGTKYHVWWSPPTGPRWAPYPRPPTSTTRGSFRTCCAWPRQSTPRSAGSTPTRPTTAPPIACSAGATASSPAPAGQASRTGRGWARSAASSSTTAPGCWPTNGWIAVGIGWPV